MGALCCFQVGEDMMLFGGTGYEAFSNETWVFNFGEL